MTSQTNLDLTEKQPTALMRLEAILKGMFVPETVNWVYQYGYNTALKEVLSVIEAMKEPELADLKQAFCEGGIETESAETWAKKWGQVEPNQP
jgi:hypothetical protein